MAFFNPLTMAYCKKKYGGGGIQNQMLVQPNIFDTIPFTEREVNELGLVRISDVPLKNYTCTHITVHLWYGEAGKNELTSVSMKYIEVVDATLDGVEGAFMQGEFETSLNDPESGLTFFVSFAEDLDLGEGIILKKGIYIDPIFVNMQAPFFAIIFEN